MLSIINVVFTSLLSFGQSAGIVVCDTEGQQFGRPTAIKVKFDFSYTAQGDKRLNIEAIGATTTILAGTQSTLQNGNSDEHHFEFKSDAVGTAPNTQQVVAKVMLPTENSVGTRFIDPSAEGKIEVTDKGGIRVLKDEYVLSRCNGWIPL